MKKFVALLLAALLLVTMVAGCSTTGGSSSSPSTKPATTPKEIVEAINAKFAGEYTGITTAVAMPAELDDQVLTDLFHVNKDDVEEYFGEYSMSMTNSDQLVAIKAKPGKAENVKKALEQRKQDLISTYETYPVNGSLDRSQAAEVYVKGDYVFLIAVGIMPEDPDAPLDFAKDVNLAKSVIDEKL